MICEVAGCLGQAVYGTKCFNHDTAAYVQAATFGGSGFGFMVKPEPKPIKPKAVKRKPKPKPKPNRRINIEPGTRFGRWTFLRFVDSDGQAACECRCECGTVRTVPSYRLRSGRSQSCGCLHRELSAERIRTKHPALGRCKNRPPCHCGRPHHAKGLCQQHYYAQWRDHRRRTQASD